MPGTLFIVGVGPGDPDLVTVKAARILGQVPVVAFFAKRGRIGHARSVAVSYLRTDVAELRFDYPFTTEVSAEDPRYATEIATFYAECARAVAAGLDAGRDVALLCEGDPFFYGSSMHLHDRLGGAYRCEVVPGVTGMSGCWTRAAVPMLEGDEVLSVVPGTLPAPALAARLAGCDAAVIMKVGRHLPKIRAALGAAGKLDRAIYVERGTMAEERVMPLAAHDASAAPYFSLVLVPGRQRAR